jgi:hypothetical protein
VRVGACGEACGVADARTRFTQADVQDFAQALLDALLAKIEAGGTAEKIAENDYLMKCTSSVIRGARGAR